MEHVMTYKAKAKSLVLVVRHFVRFNSHIYTPVTFGMVQREDNSELLLKISRIFPVWVS